MVVLIFSESLWTVIETTCSSFAADMSTKTSVSVPIIIIIIKSSKLTTNLNQQLQTVCVRACVHCNVTWKRLGTGGKEPPVRGIIAAVNDIQGEDLVQSLPQSSFQLLEMHDNKPKWSWSCPILPYWLLGVGSAFDFGVIYNVLSITYYL